MKASVNQKYMLLQGLFWMMYCVATGFVSLCLLEKGFDNKSIGVITAVFCTVSALLQPLLGRICDNSERLSWKKMIIILSVPFFAVCVFMLLLPGKTIAGVLVGLLLLLINTIMPFLNAALSYYETSGEKINFGIARGIGSGTFAILSYIIGFIAATHGAKTVPVCGIIVVTLFTLVVLKMPYNNTKTSNSNGIAACTDNNNTVNTDNSNIIATCIDSNDKSATNNIINVTNTIEDLITSNSKKCITKDANNSAMNISTATANGKDNGGFLRKYPGFIIMFVAFIFAASSHNVSLLYLLQIIQSLGGGSKQYGIAIAIMAIAEVPVLFCFSIFIRRFSAKTLMLVSAAGYGIKALAFALCGSVISIYFAELTQMVSFALFASASVYYTVEMIGEGDQGTGQALMTSTMTLGSVLGSLIGGVLLDMCGIRKMLVINVMIALSGIILAIISYGIDRTKHNKAQKI